MNKLNKKGFTLIEMLVVIAIIAVLVAIIIPTVTSATEKAAAAANAANLRSYKAELVTAMLSGDKVTVTGTSPKYSVTVDNEIRKTAPKSKKCGTVEKDLYPNVTCTDGSNLVVTFGGNTIEKFAAVAETGTTTGLTAAGSGVEQNQKPDGK